MSVFSSGAARARRENDVTTSLSGALSVLRIYLPRRGVKHGRGFWGWLFGRSITHHLAAEALRSGVLYATVTQGHMGFVSGSTAVVADLSDTPPDTLPSCVELIGTPEILEAFVTAHRDDLRGAVIVRLDGVALSIGGPS
ncbi:DUF190 domain-containing protein [Polyangium fumosum]|uniref:Uncharacterized protein n=1 Tax=Polyangium fumosum TaxID=889272 RepID=A0A4U1J594_9BACT|nr:DUF190 domain-containing protein [Polyangium fumosum]TKD02422.1 hypothetical protein E8A74_28420 [Polyangium fumosum]